MIDLKQMEAVFAAQSISLSSGQMAQLDRYADLLVQWNQRMNLTAITEPEEILIKHFLDSILPFSLVSLPENAALIDVGTGAGFPAIPLLIWRPDLRITLLDSLKKRLTFLEEVGRQPSLREQFDIATARAVANLRELSEYCLPYVRPGGLFYSLKGGDVQAEAEDAQKAIRLLGGRMEQNISYSLPEGSRRTLICIKKISQTSTKFPRNAAKMAKAPLV